MVKGTLMHVNPEYDAIIETSTVTQSVYVYIVTESKEIETLVEGDLKGMGEDHKFFVKRLYTLPGHPFLVDVSLNYDIEKVGDSVERMLRVFGFKKIQRKDKWKQSTPESKKGVITKLLDKFFNA